MPSASSSDLPRPDGPTSDGTPRLFPATGMVPASESTPRMKSRWIFSPRAEGWQEFALSEWSLSAASWTDFHPHSETNVVLEGELHVESEGSEVVARAGDTVTVPAGSVGRYWAPVHARMLAVYGPNPDGSPTDIVGYAEL